MWPRPPRIWAWRCFRVTMPTPRQAARMQVCCFAWLRRDWAFFAYSPPAPFSGRVRKGSCYPTAAAAEPAHIAFGTTYIACGQLYHPLHAYPRVPGRGYARCVWVGEVFCLEWEVNRCLIMLQTGHPSRPHSRVGRTTPGMPVTVNGTRASASCLLDLSMANHQRRSRVGKGGNEAEGRPGTKRENSRRARCVPERF